MSRTSTDAALDACLPRATIALDLRLVGYAAGIAAYGTQLARGLARQGGPERYLLLHGRRADPSVVAGIGTAARRCLTPPHHRLERWTLPAEVLAHRPALLHSIDHVAPAWGPWRSVVTVHDLAFLRFPETHTRTSLAYYRATAASVRRAQRVIAVSRSTAADLAELLDIDPGRVRVVHNAAGAAFHPRPFAELEEVAGRLGVDPRRPYVLFVGTLEPRKNLPLLLEAFANLRARPPHRDLRLLLAGAGGWLDDALFDAPARLGLGGSARFLGRRTEAELAVLYSHAAVFAFPSLYEGFGLVLLEAMACGAPVVSSSAGPMPEVVGSAGLLLPPRDPAAWADALARVLEDGTLALDLRRRGFARAAEFSWERAARETRQVYCEALSA